MLPVHDLIWKWWREITDKNTNRQLLQSNTQGCRFPSQLEVQHTKWHRTCCRRFCLTQRKNATKHSTGWDIAATVLYLPLCSSSWLPPNPKLTRGWEIKAAISYRHQPQNTVTHRMLALLGAVQNLASLWQPCGRLPATAGHYLQATHNFWTRTDSVLRYASVICRKSVLPEVINPVYIVWQRTLGVMV